MHRATVGRWQTGGLILCAAAIIAGCAPLQAERLRASAAAFPEPIELRSVPFFPQEAYQCGPAALATLLSYSGVEVTPEQLAPQVYVPERQGSFQLELLAAARRHARIPYVLAPRLEALATELASGHPVLVLQNLGLWFAPTWHYAVVVGLDVARGEVVLRSGREERHMVALDTFEYTWRRGDYWAIVIASPGRLPFTAEELTYLQSVVAMERIGNADAAADGYTAALGRWPQGLGAWLGLGNARHALGDLTGAEQAFRRAAELHPTSIAAWNNLAQTLADLRRYDEAETTARHALTLESADPLAETLQQTLDEILKAKTNQGKP